tara:strand:- start:382 stop:1104 length:723 start_codon:yes stop_codon:yes gene_type:complete
MKLKLFIPGFMPGEYAFSDDEFDMSLYDFWDDSNIYNQSTDEYSCQIIKKINNMITYAKSVDQKITIIAHSTGARILMMPELKNTVNCKYIEKFVLIAPAISLFLPSKMFPWSNTSEVAKLKPNCHWIEWSINKFYEVDFKFDLSSKFINEVLGYNSATNRLKIGVSDFITYMRAFIPRIENYNLDFPTDKTLVILAGEDNQVDSKETKKFLDKYYPKFEIVILADQSHSPDAVELIKYF